MIEERTKLVLRCNTCGTVMEENGNEMLFDNDEEAGNAAYGKGWVLWDNEDVTCCACKDPPKRQIWQCWPSWRMR